MQLSFNSELAGILFATPANPERQVAEKQVLERLEKLFASTSREDIFKIAPQVDGVLMASLSGRNALRAAQMIEDRASMAIAKMPRVKAMHDRLVQAHEIQEILRGLPRMIEVLSQDVQPRK